ncbi:xanthan lyase [Puteibacter caeruleilacunae]|nr:xanthan lyase [Puteibacter caeruleilacunae]
MISLHNILTVAKYENRTLFRSWFFRIFAGLALLALFGFNIGVLTDLGESLWQVKAIPSAIPYTNLLILNLAQAIIAVFLASDFLKRDKKLDTTEVIYMRPMTNTEYVVGKTVGNLGVFVALNIIVLVMTAIFNLIADGVAVDWSAYIIYLLLISIPTLIFILGLSFFLMSLLRNQALTFILLLGYIAATIFYLQHKFYYLFDYMAYNIPLFKSEMVGFGNLPVIVGHRSIYLFFGLGFIALTIALLPRLAQNSRLKQVSPIIAIMFIALGVMGGYKHISRILDEGAKRDQYIELNNKYAGKTSVDILEHEIHLIHKNTGIEVTSGMLLRANGSEQLIFTLNPKLVVSKITNKGKDVKFNREKHLIRIDRSDLSTPKDSLQLEIKYQGTIDESLCYLDIEDELRNSRFSNFMYSVDPRYAFVTPGYALLTPEASWYPTAGVTFSDTNTRWLKNDFTKFKLHVKTDDRLQAISQGKRSSVSEGEYTFEPEKELPQLSLAIGAYQEMFVEKDSIKFSIWHYEGHDYFSSLLTEVKDTIADLAIDRLRDFERQLNMEYSYPRFSIVEVPAQFRSFARLWKSHQEITQPEMVFLPEKGYNLRDADFEGRLKRAERYAKERQMSEKDMQEQVVNNFVRNFTTNEARPNFRRGRGGNYEVDEVLNPYFQFAQFYNFKNYMHSDDWPIINRVLEAYLQSSVFSPRSMWMRNFSGLSEDEKANLLLQEKSFAELLGDKETDSKIIDNIISLKGKVLFSLIEAKVGAEDLVEFIKDFLDRNRFCQVEFSDFEKEVKDKFDVDLDSFMNLWFNESRLPAFLFSEIETTKTDKEDYEATVVRFKVTNTEDVSGIAKVTFRVGGGPGGGRGRGRGFGGGPSTEDNIEKAIYLEGNETREICYVFEENPRAMVVNTMTSKNIPSLIVRPFAKIERDDKIVAEEYDRISDEAVTLHEKNEIIVDNEDPEFRVIQEETKSLLKEWLLKEDENGQKYAGFNQWRPPSNWKLTTNSSFYGTLVRSAYYIKSGDGNKKAQWHVPVKESGYYDVFYYVGKGQSRWRGNPKGELQLSINHDDGTEEQTLSYEKAEDGWNHLGSFYFSPDTALIELSNKSELRSIVADAVKLVKQ